MPDKKSPFRVQIRMICPMTRKKCPTIEMELSIRGQFLWLFTPRRITLELEAGDGMHDLKVSAHLAIDIHN
jgi:hypothetical protein